MATLKPARFYEIDHRQKDELKLEPRKQYFSDD